MKNQLLKFIKLCKKTELIPVVILGSSVNGLSYFRSLREKGMPLLCLDYYYGCASKSRCGTFILLDSEKNDDIPGEKTADRIFQIFNQHGITPVVFGTADEWQVYIARRHDSDKKTFLSLSPNSTTMESIVDKQAQYEAAKSVDVNVPAFANAADVAAEKTTWTVFPAIIKPRWAHLGRAAIGGKALLVDTKESLSNELQKLKKDAELDDYLVQQVIEGRDNCLYSYLACFHPAGKEFTGLLKRKLRQYPPFLGDGSYDATCRDEALAQATRKLLAAINYEGLVGVEFKKYAGSEDFGLIEINPRTVSTNQLATNSGINFPWITYQLIVHLAFPEKMDKPEPPEGYRENVAHMNEERDFKTFLILHKQGELSFFAWLKCVKKAGSFALWDLRDPWPFFSMILTICSRRLKRLSS